jgi:hypothetical protein
VQTASGDKFEIFNLQFAIEKCCEFTKVQRVFNCKMLIASGKLQITVINLKFIIYNLQLKGVFFKLAV